MVTTSTCARIGVPTCCEHVPHTTSATVKPQVTSEDIIFARVRSLSARPSVNIRVYWCEDGYYTGSYRRSKLVTCVHDA